MRLETERLILRTPIMTDLNEYIEVRNSEGYLKYNPMAEVSSEEAIIELEGFITNGGCLMIEHKKDGKMIGQLDYFVDGLRYGVKAKTISYNMNPLYTGRGYVTEALRGFLEYLFDVEGLDIVSARVYEGNFASMKVLEKLHFVQEGTLRQAVKGPDGVIHDDLLFSLLKEDYMKQ